MNLDELDKKVKKNKEYLNNYLKESYHYAKSLGFSSAEAGVLSKNSKETIHRLSRERKEKENAE